MSQQNVEIVRAHYASFSRLTEGDEVRAHVLAYYDPSCEYRPVEEIDPIQGHAAQIEWTERWVEAWTSFRVEIEEIIDAGGEVIVAEITTNGRGRTSDVEIGQRFFHVFEMRDGRILRQHEYQDRDVALEAAGLSP